MQVARLQWVKREYFKVCRDVPTNELEMADLGLGENERKNKEASNIASFESFTTDPWEWRNIKFYSLL